MTYPGANTFKERYRYVLMWIVFKLFIKGYVTTGYLTTSSLASVTAKQEPNEAIYINEDNITYTVYYKYGNLTDACNTMPVNATHFIFSHSQYPLKILKESPFVNLTELRVLKLINSKIHSILNDAFLGLDKLERLNLSSNYIRFLPIDVFEPCPNVHEVDLSCNFIVSFQSISKALSILSRLQILDVNTNVMINFIWENDLEPLRNTSLNTLDLTACQTEIVHPKAFSKLKFLRVLKLSYNFFTYENLTLALSSLYATSIDILELEGLRFLTKFPIDALNTLSNTNITLLILSGNKFEEITDLPLLPSLKILRMNNCDIQHIQKIEFINFPNLLELDLSWNQLSRFPVEIENLYNLKILDLSGNKQLSDLPFLFDKIDFVNLANLEELILNDVPVKGIRTLTFTGLKYLRKLFLRTAKIDNIDDFSFQPLSSLEILDLSFNRILSFSSYTFAGLENVKELHLNAIGIKFDPRTLIFHHLKRLNVLTLNYNDLTIIPSHELENMPSLKILLLVQNRIISWPNETIRNDSNLTFLSLRRNSIININANMLADFSKLQLLDISENPFNCSNCELEKFLDWINKTNVHVESKSHMKCLIPESLNGLSISEAAFEHCIIRVEDITLKLSVSLSVVVFILFTAGGVCVYHRWYIRYLWVLIREKRRKTLEKGTADNFKYDAFVAYNDDDRPWILTYLLPKLEEEEPRFKLCLHERDFVIGQEIICNIIDSIECSRKVILLLSNSFLASQWCMWEANMAQFITTEDGRNAIITVLLENLEKEKLTSRLRHLFHTCTYLKWIPNSPEAETIFWKRLRNVLKKSTDKTSNPEESVL